MKNIVVLFLTAGLLILAACNREKKSERFLLLTENIWASDSLLANGVDASGPGQTLELFKGDARFNVDGTGTFGQYAGTWMFADNETNLVISSPDLPVTISTLIVELTSLSLKVTFTYPGVNPLEIRMTFKSK